MGIFKKLTVAAIFLTLLVSLTYVPQARAEDLLGCELQGDETVPNRFPVGKCLNTEGQRNRVPERVNGTPTEDQEKAGIVYVLIDAIDLLVKWTAALALIVFIIGALLTMVSEGKEDKLEKGKSAMLLSLVGLAIALFAMVIVTFVQSLLF